MLGFYYCPDEGMTHDDWFHGKQLIICNRCKSKKSVRKTNLVNGLIKNKIEFLVWSVPQERIEIFRDNVLYKDINPFDINEVKKSFVMDPEMITFINDNIDDYIRIACLDFKDPQDVQNSYLISQRSDFG